MDWKNKLEKGININAMLVNYENFIKILEKNVSDLTAKNKALHKASHLAHQTLTEWVDDNEPYVFLEGIKDLKGKIEEIISSGLPEESEKNIPEKENKILTL